MSSPFGSPVVRYGLSVVNAALIALIAVFLLDGLIRWVVFGIAVVEIVVTPQILKHT